MSFTGLADIAPGMAIARRFRSACAYCKSDPVKPVCVNCGAPQESAEQAPILITDRVLTTAQIAAVRRHWREMYS